MTRDTRNTKKSAKGYWLLAFIFAGVIAGCSERKDPASELTPEQRWARSGITWTTEQLQQLDRGNQLYQTACAGCHLGQGQGQVVIGAPALNKNALVTANDRRNAIQVVLSGRNVMPAFDASFDDNQLADILSYVGNAWDNRSNDTISAADISQVRSSLLQDSKE